MVTQTTFAAMQEAELAWWANFMGHPTAKQRMWALYGARYYGFFFAEMLNPGKTVEIGSGPLPVMEVMNAPQCIAVDSLKYEGLTDWSLFDASQVPDGWADTVLLLNVLDHTDDPQALIDEAWRMLIPGGKALVFVHLGQQDDKHRLVEQEDVEAWLSAFEIQRSWVEAPVIYDPAAYLAVAVKSA